MHQVQEEIKDRDGLKYSFHELDTRKNRYFKKIPDIEKVIHKRVPTSKKIAKISSGKRISRIIFDMNEVQRETRSSQAKIRRLVREKATLKREHKNFMETNSFMISALKAEIQDLMERNIALGTENNKMKIDHRDCVLPDNLDTGLKVFVAKKAQEQQNFMDKFYENFGAQFQDFLKSDANFQQYCEEKRQSTKNG